jgi:hypothetical protein
MPFQSLAERAPGIESWNYSVHLKAGAEAFTRGTIPAEAEVFYSDVRGPEKLLYISRHLIVLTSGMIKQDSGEKD